MENEIRSHAATATMLQGLKIELAKERQASLKEQTLRKKSETERDRVLLEKQIVEEEKNKVRALVYLSSLGCLCGRMMIVASKDLIDRGEECVNCSWLGPRVRWRKSSPASGS